MELCFPHQYIDRNTGDIISEELVGDRMVRLIYSRIRENASCLFNLVTGSVASELLACFHYDFTFKSRSSQILRMIRDLAIDKYEIIDIKDIRTVRQLFERQIRYWQTRPMPQAENAVVSPSDSRIIPGSLNRDTVLFIKDKFFHYSELLGTPNTWWLDTFKDGYYAVFRLTPDKYHYNHMPVSGRVLDIYEVKGMYHSCNPSAVIEVMTPYSKNRRMVTIIDTDIPGGTYVGRVAMIEIVALMIGDIVQCYSDYAYDNPRNVKTGDFLRKGQPKSLFRPGSSTVVLLFEKDRFAFSHDLTDNVIRKDVNSRFTKGFGQPLVETDLTVRSEIGRSI